MTLRGLLQKEKEDLQKAYQSIKIHVQEQQGPLKVGLGVTYSYSEFFILFVFGILFVLGGLIPLIMAIASLFYPPDSTGATVFIWSVTIMIEAIGITTVTSFTRKISRRNDDLLENEVLKIAMQNNGVVKEQDFYIRPLSVWRSKRMIKRFLSTGTIEVKEFRDEGNLYIFPQVISENEKLEAKGILEFE